YGVGIGPPELQVNRAQGGIFGKSVAGVKVTFDGIEAPLLYVSSRQVGVAVPAGIRPPTSRVVVSYSGASSPAVTVPVATTAPALFSSNSSGAGPAAAINMDGSINSAVRPVKIGDYLSLYATGGGQSS